MRLLFVGESWLGCCARSLKEALARQSDVTVDEVNEDLYVPRPRARWLRAIARVVRSAYRQEIYGQVLYRVNAFKPDVVVFDKGGPIEAALVQNLRSLGCKVAKVYPDCSPHAHGAQHKTAVGGFW